MIIETIKKDISQQFYQQNFPNDGQRFVAWYMHEIHSLDDLQTKDSVTDGTNDKQIDAVYIDEDEQKIYIVQGKFYQGPSIGAEPVREVISAWNSFHDRAKLQENANEKLKIKIAEISEALDNDTYTICFELVTTSTFTAAAQKDIEAFQLQLSKSPSTEAAAQFSAIDITDLEDLYKRAKGQSGPILDYTIHLENGKYLNTVISSTQVLIAAVPLKECIKLPGIKDGSLFQKNVRQSLGINNTVNKKISRTINNPESCHNFFFYHNGITAICNKMICEGEGVYKFYGLSVVNGCQSLNTILSCSENVKKRDNAYVLFRFYEIPQPERADDISTNTNTQSAVKARDLRSNSPQVRKLKTAYEKMYPNGIFLTKRGEDVPGNKDKNYVVELSSFGKQLTAWYMQRPNLSYGETKIFDKYFSVLFKPEYKAEDIFALTYWMSRVMKAWSKENPLGLDETLLTMKAYAPYHLLYSIERVFSKCNGQNSVPSPYQCLKHAKEANLIDLVISIAANCLNNAFVSARDNNQEGKTFIPQNWIKNKASIRAIDDAVLNYFSFLPAMNKEQNTLLKSSLKLLPEDFTPRVQADD